MMQNERTDALRRTVRLYEESVSGYVWLEKDDRGEINLCVSDVSSTDIAPYYVLCLSARGTIELFGDLNSKAVGLQLDPYDDSAVVE
jgi:hypothetical protein